VTGVKICGLNDPASVAAASRGGADWIGFIFFPASPRHVTASRAALLSAGLPGGAPKRVGVFVAPEDEQIAAVLDHLSLDVLQLYVPPARAAAVRRRFGVPVWRAVGVASAADLPVDGDGIDGFLIEAKPPHDATRPGGNALPLDWAVLAGWSAPLPWLLGGGLNQGNVARAIAVSGAPAVDVSSGLERAPGVKDPKLIEAFLSTVRA
jgi:phosphoribosylanthranilate isomerase